MGMTFYLKRYFLYGDLPAGSRGPHPNPPALVCRCSWTLSRCSETFRVSWLYSALSHSLSPCSAVMTSHCSLHVYLQADTHIHTLRRSVLCVYSLPVSQKEKIGEWVCGGVEVCVFVCVYSGWAIDRWISEVTERKGEMCEGEESLMDCEESKNNDVVCGYVCLMCVCGCVFVCLTSFYLFPSWCSSKCFSHLPGSSVFLFYLITSVTSKFYVSNDSS